MYCRICGESRPVDAKGVCPTCRARLNANPEMRVTQLYCTRCGDGPGHWQIFNVEGVCWKCRGRPLNLRPLVPPSAALRPRVPCRGCGGGAFVRVTAVPDRTIKASSEWGEEAVRPLALALLRGPHEIYTALGTLEAYVCRACGLTELYCRDHDTLPIGPEWGTELFEVPIPAYR